MKLFLTILGLISLSTFLSTSALATDAYREVKKKWPTKHETKRELKATIAQKRDMSAKITGVVTSVGTNSITVRSGEKSYTINILAATEDTNGTVLKRRFLGKATLAEFSIDNKVKVHGTWVDDARTAIDAARIWNMSISKYKGTFVGTVQSIDSTTIVFDPVKRERHVAYLGPTTAYRNRTGRVITLSDIKMGDKVRIRGTWDKSNKKVFDVTLVVSMSLPPLPTKSQ